MTLFVLDTDHLSLFQRGYGPLLPRIQAVPASRMAITIISVEEMLQGRLAQVRRAGQGEERINAYTWLEKTIRFFQFFQILSFDTEVERRYAALLARRFGDGGVLADHRCPATRRAVAFCRFAGGITAGSG